MEHLSFKKNQQKRPSQVSLNSLGVYAEQGSNAYRPQRGELIQDRFFVCAPPLGRGNVGTVYQVLDTEGNSYSLKQLPRKLLSHPRALKRLHQDFQQLVKLHHANLVSVYEVFEDKGAIYLLSEHIQGISLRDLLHRVGAFPIELSCFLILKLLDALEYLHQQGISFGEIKPENILISEEGYVKFTDYGLFWSDYGVFCGQDGLSKSLLYAPPERFQGKTSKTTGITGDFYALGMVWLEMMLGEVPVFHGISDVATLAKKKQAKDLSFLSLVPDPQVNLLLQNLLRSDDSERLNDGEELRPFLKSYSCSATFARTLFREWIQQKQGNQHFPSAPKAFVAWGENENPEHLVLPESQSFLPKGKETFFLFLFTLLFFCGLWGHAFWLQLTQETTTSVRYQQKKKTPRVMHQQLGIFQKVKGKK